MKKPSNPNIAAEIKALDRRIEVFEKWLISLPGKYPVEIANVEKVHMKFAPNEENVWELTCSGKRLLDWDIETRLYFPAMFHNLLTELESQQQTTIRQIRGACHQFDEHFGHLLK